MKSLFLLLLPLLLPPTLSSLTSLEIYMSEMETLAREMRDETERLYKGRCESVLECSKKYFDNCNSKVRMGEGGRERICSCFEGFLNVSSSD